MTAVADHDFLPVEVEDKESEIEIYFKNDYEGYETNFTLLDGGFELWSDSCAGSECVIADSLSAAGLACDELILLIDRGASLLASALVKITANGSPAVLKETSLSGVSNRRIKRIKTGQHSFTC